MILPLLLSLVAPAAAEAPPSYSGRESRTELPIVIRDPATGTYLPAVRSERNRFRVDWLFSYQPTPGTVVFAGYGSTLTEPEGLRFRALRRDRDGFFLKVSYLFRM